jgi:flavin-dependent dehydrogenase
VNGRRFALNSQGPSAGGKVVIAGGGLAGSAAACLLAQAGSSVLLIEREAQPAHKVCGEFISVEAQMYLASIGIDLAALGAQKITRLRLVRGRDVVETALPFQAAGLSRLVLDEALLARAAICGAEIRRGHTISAAVRHNDAIVLDISGIGKVRTPTLFLATGKHDLRGLRRQPARPPEDLVGFKLHLRLSTAQRRLLDGHVEVIMFPDGYAGLQLVEHGRANLCLLVARTRLQQAGGTWEGLRQDLQHCEPHLAARLNGAEPLQERPLSIHRAPFGFVHAPSATDPDGVYRLGDQVGVIPSFTGDGMSIALHSAYVAVDCHLASLDAAAYHRRIRRDIAGQIGRAFALYRFARRAPGQAVLMHVAAAWPAGLELATRLTRVPPRALSAAAFAA